MLTIIKKWFENLYLSYELITCVYMFEPWERKLINGIVLLIVSLITFSSYAYLPKYIETFVRFLSPIPVPLISEIQHERKVAI